MKVCRLLFRSAVPATLAMAFSGAAVGLTLEDYTNPSPACFNRATQPYLTVADTHIHFRPFGGESVSYHDMLKLMADNGVVFGGVMGIGQRLPWDARPGCDSYQDCRDLPANPTIKNDFVNAANFAEFKSPGRQLVFSMTFPDLARPAEIPALIALYDKEYPGLFKLMGEANVVKQALFPNGHVPVTTAQIDQWADFMKILRERNIPLALHSDLGNDTGEPTKYRPLLEHVLRTYPDNKIIWLHLGMSSQQVAMDPLNHILLLQGMLDRFPNLYLDISWGVLEQNYFSKYRQGYVDFINRNSSRIITGSDYVAYKNKQPAYNYADELKTSSAMNAYLNNDAFRNIALGQTYLTLLGMNATYNAPQICPSR